MLLAADIGNLVIPVLLIGGAIVQWLMSRKGDDGASPPSNEEPRWDDAPPRRGVTPQDPTGEWGDLMEALGKKPAPQDTFSSPPVPSYIPAPTAPPIYRPKTIITPVPPPVPNPVPPSAPAWNVPVEISAYDEREASPDSRRLQEAMEGYSMEKEDKATRFEAFSTLAERPEEIITPFKHRNNLRSILSDGHSMRTAVVLNEVLGKPVSLR